MSKNPLNLTLRFILELVGLYALGLWGWNAHTGALRWLWTLALPLAAAVVWGVFRVDDDPAKAPVKVPGLARLLLEGFYFGAATWAFYAAGRPSWALAFGLIVLAHYLISYDRIAWLLKQYAP